jgi:hypothetical protein
MLAHLAHSPTCNHPEAQIHTEQYTIPHVTHARDRATAAGNSRPASRQRRVLGARFAGVLDPAHQAAARLCVRGPAPVSSSPPRQARCRRRRRTPCSPPPSGQTAPYPVRTVTTSPSSFPPSLLLFAPIITLLVRQAVHRGSAFPCSLIPSQLCLILNRAML